MDKCCPHATALPDLLCWNKYIVILCVLVRGEGGESYWIIGGVRWSAHLAKAGRRREGENKLAGRPPYSFFEGDGKTTNPVVVKKKLTLTI
jgi:hypothetical protein